MAYLPAAILGAHHSAPGLHLRRLREDHRTHLILTGGRDEFCTIEQAVAAFRHLPNGELAVLPGHGHYIPPFAIATTIDYFERQLAT